MDLMGCTKEWWIRQCKRMIPYYKGRVKAYKNKLAKLESENGNKYDIRGAKLSLEHAEACLKQNEQKLAEVLNGPD